MQSRSSRSGTGLPAALGQYADHRLPELFVGYAHHEVPLLVEYPTSSRPQAWASGSIFLLIAAMLGVTPLIPARPGHARPFLPTGVGWLRLDGICVDGRMVAVEVSGAGAQIRRRVDDHDAPRRGTERGLRKSS